MNFKIKLIKVLGLLNNTITLKALKKSCCSLAGKTVLSKCSQRVTLRGGDGYFPRGKGVNTLRGTLGVDCRPAALFSRVSVLRHRLRLLSRYFLLKSSMSTL